jgi:hypothetical protein
MAALLRWLLLAPTVITQGLEPDFYLRFDRCKTTVAYLVPQQEPLRQLDGTGLLLACSRSSRRLTCEMSFADRAEGVKGNRVSYRVDLDSPPHLTFTDSVFADYYSVNVVEHRATLVTRVLDKQFAGAKVCTGSFATAMEVRALQRKKG